MNLSEIRAQARTIRNQTNGIFSLFAIPTLVTILSTYLSPNRHLEEIVPQLEINQAFVVIFGRQIFPQIVEFIIALLFLSASFSKSSGKNAIRLALQILAESFLPSFSHRFLSHS